MIGIIVQARSKSTRFPRKIFADINGKYTLQRVLDGVTSSKLAHKIILAMPEYDRSEIKGRIEAGELTKYVAHRGFSVYCGEPDDVLKRYYDAAGINGIDLIVRITADCPFIQGSMVDEMLIDYLSAGQNNYMYNGVGNKEYPNGLDIEIFPWWMLAYTHINAKSAVDREHVTTFMKTLDVSVFNNMAPNITMSMKHKDFSFDTIEDYDLIYKIAKHYDKSGDLNDALEKTDI